MADHVHEYIYPALVCVRCGETVFADEVEEIINSRPLFGIRGRNPFSCSYTDVTSLMKIGEVDDESLPVDECVCGERFGHWDFIVSIYKDDPVKCPKCNRKFFFTNKVTVYQVFEPQITGDLDV